MAAPANDACTLGQRISTARKAKGFNQSQLAKKIGASRAAVSKWERDLTDVIGSNLVLKLADVLEVNERWLVGEDAQSPAPPNVSVEEKSLMEHYRRLPRADRELLRQFARLLLTRNFPDESSE